MPLRIDTGRLSDLASQRGQFQADASARNWQTLGSFVPTTMGAYQGEVTPQERALNNRCARRVP